MSTQPEKSILTEAQGLVHGDRQQDYGHPIDDFTRTAKMWTALKGVTFTAEDVAMFMVCVKLSRQVNRPKRDNLVDAAGYCETLRMVIDERLRRAELTETFGPIEGGTVDA